jgi:hypothetical protein
MTVLPSAAFWAHTAAHKSMHMPLLDKVSATTLRTPLLSALLCMCCQLAG